MILINVASITCCPVMVPLTVLRFQSSDSELGLAPIMMQNARRPEGLRVRFTD